MSARFIVLGQTSRGTGCLQIMEIDKGQLKLSSEVCGDNPKHQPLRP